MSKRRLSTFLVLAWAGCIGRGDAPHAAHALGPSSGMVISQIYGGGGNGGAVLSHDYVELFNRGVAAVDLDGGSLQYAAAGGTSWQVHALPAATVPPGGYFLVRLASGGGSGVALPATPDSTGTINLGASGGKVALVDGTAACGDAVNPCSTSTALVDLVGYGSANDYEGSGAAPAPASNNDALLRGGSGCTDTDDNAGDLALATWSSATALTLHDSSAAAQPCAAPDGGTAVPGAAVVISQIYGAGGNSGASYTHDFVELHNRSAQPVALGGWSVQYGAATSNFSQQVDLAPGTSLPAGAYFLLQLAAGAGGNGVALPAADASGGINLSATAGKVALVRATTALACGAAATPCSGAEIEDLVGYGASATAYEGSAPAPAAGSAADAVQRGVAGCVDTDDNAADFAADAVTPRNSASTAKRCNVLLDAGTAVDQAVADRGVDAADAAPADAAPLLPQLVVISQVYGAGGNTGASHANDYVELFNRSDQTAQIGGWSLQYASAANNFTQKIDLPAGATIAAGGYYLVQLGAGSAGDGAALPTPDHTGTTNIAATAGKLALVRGAALLGCGAAGAPCSAPEIEDLVGYGATATAYEGSAPAPTPGSAANALLRLLGGCSDTNDNGADFAVDLAAPRNSAAASNSCAAALDAAVPDLAPADGGVDGGDAAPIADAAADAGLPPTQQVVISQIYGAGGNSGASYTHDYVELFNRGDQLAQVGGWSLQYASAANDFAQQLDLPAGTTIPAGGYLLVQLNAGAGGNGAALPAADLAGAINLSATAGKVALVRSASLLGCGSAARLCSSPAIEDLVGYGPSATDFEGSAPAPSPGAATNAVMRAAGGCVDTDENANDLAAAPANPRNSAAPGNDCDVVLDAGVIPDSGAPPDQGPPADAAPPADSSPAPDSTAVPAHVVVISQIYGAGGNSGASYTHDYVELFNRHDQAVAIGGWSLQYGSAANDLSLKADLPAGASVAAGGYFLVQLDAGGAGAGSALPAPDFAASGTEAFNMAATAGKVALVRGTSPLGCGAAANRCSSPLIEDLVGYGASASDYEGAPASAPGGSTNAATRDNGGCTDTDDNAADFAGAAAAPRNSAAPTRDCSAVPVPDAGPPPADAAGPADGAPPRDAAPARDGKPSDASAPRADARRDAAIPPDSGGEGCGCRASGAGGSGAGAWLALALVGLLGERRRRRRR